MSAESADFGAVSVDFVEAAAKEPMPEQAEEPMPGNLPVELLPVKQLWGKALSLLFQ